MPALAIAHARSISLRNYLIRERIKKQKTESNTTIKSKSKKLFKNETNNK